MLCFHLCKDETRVQPSSHHYQERWWMKDWRRKQEEGEEEEENDEKEDFVMADAETPTKAPQYFH